MGKLYSELQFLHKCLKDNLKKYRASTLNHITMVNIRGYLVNYALLTKSRDPICGRVFLFGAINFKGPIF